MKEDSKDEETKSAMSEEDNENDSAISEEEEVSQNVSAVSQNVTLLHNMFSIQDRGVGQSRKRLRNQSIRLL